VQADQAIRRAKKGGALTELQVVAVARLTAGGKRLQKTLNLTAKQAGQLGPESQLQPLLKALKVDKHRHVWPRTSLLAASMGEGVGMCRDTRLMDLVEFLQLEKGEQWGEGATQGCWVS